MSRAKLELLPPELIEIIASYLLPAYGLENERSRQYTRCPTELLYFRLTCRILSSHIQCFFIKKVLLANKQRFRNLSGVSTTFTSLNHLDALLRIGPVTETVECIKFDSTTLDEYSLRLCAGRCLGCDKMFLDFERVNLTRMRIEDIVNNPEASMTLHMDYQDHLYEQEWMMATQDYDALVNRIFSHGFAKLKDISIGGSNDNTLGRLYAYERSHSHSLLVNGKIECSSSLLPGVWRSQHDQLTRASAAIIRSLARNNVEARSLSVVQGTSYSGNFRLGTAGVWVLDQPLQILQAFQVHDLTLQLSNGTNDSHPLNWTTSRGRDILMRALDALSSLQGLSLAPTRSDIFDCDITRHVLQHCPPRLKRFRLHDFAVKRQALSDFIDQRRRTLRFLGFTRAHLLRELWRPLILQLYRIGIPFLEIGFLYELSEESYRIIQFPALPRGHGAVPNDMGSFENGRWRVGQQGEEFFLQLSIDNPMDEYKVQAGLSHILRNGSRPEYRWATSTACSLVPEYQSRHKYRWATRVAWLDTKEMFVAPKYETFAMGFFGVTPFRRILALRGR